MGIQVIYHQYYFGTVKLNGLNSADWLKETLEKLSVWPNSRIDELLPLTSEQIEAIKQKLPEKAKW
jgi:transposase